MACVVKVSVLVLFFVCFPWTISATSCLDGSDCNGYRDICCSDYVCRENCLYCSTDSQCGTGECCDNNGDCKTSCFSGSGGVIAGDISSIVFLVIIGSIVACCCCACCPYYRYQHPGAVIVTAPANQAAIVSTTTTQATIQHPAPIAYHPPPAGYNAPPPPGGYNYNQPPPPYYPQPQAGQPAYPPQQVQGPYPSYPPSAGYPGKQ